jgi:polar amino acid transport system substrate-binding protein
VKRRQHLAAAVTAAAALALAGCGAQPLPGDTLAPAAAPVEQVSPPAAETCDNPRQSFEPKGGFPARSLQQQIRDRRPQRLVVGVSGDSLLLGSRDPDNPNTFRGFDIDLARAVGRAILGEGGENRVQFRVITAAQRIPLVNDGADAGGVDLVARNMTMNCSRWEDVNFSATYFVADQRVLVRQVDEERSSAQELGEREARVCAPRGSTSIQRIANLPEYEGIVPVQVDQHTTCLALLQQGRVEAITGDSTVLAGLAAQDGRVVVLPGSLGEEPYGLAVAQAHPEFAAFVNDVLRDYVADGRWQASYERFFADALGPAQAPAPEYGRQ